MRPIDQLKRGAIATKPNATMTTDPEEYEETPEPPDDPRDLEGDYWRDELRDRRMEEAYDTNKERK